MADLLSERSKSTLSYCSILNTLIRCTKSREKLTILRYTPPRATPVAEKPIHKDEHAALSFTTHMNPVMRQNTAKFFDTTAQRSSKEPSYERLYRDAYIAIQDSLRADRLAGKKSAARVAALARHKQVQEQTARVSTFPAPESTVLSFKRGS